MKGRFILWGLCLTVSAWAGPVSFEYEHPDKFQSGEAIPAELIPDIRETVFVQRFGDTNWLELSTTETFTNRITAQVPVGSWRIAVTAQFLDDVTTRSELSSNLLKKVYGKLATVNNLKILIVTE